MFGGCLSFVVTNFGKCMTIISSNIPSASLSLLLFHPQYSYLILFHNILNAPLITLFSSCASACMSSIYLFLSSLILFSAMFSLLLNLLKERFITGIMFLLLEFPFHLKFISFSAEILHVFKHIVHFFPLDLLID